MDFRLTKINPEALFDQHFPMCLGVYIYIYIWGVYIYLCIYFHNITTDKMEGGIS